MPISFFRCKKCKREYDNFADAKKCEQEHLKITKACIKRYGVQRHPYEVEITFSNGEIITYLPEYMRV